MATPSLKVEITRAGDIVTVALVGEAHVDFDTADAHVQAVLAHHPRCVVVDASELTFITSIGMCFLINLRRHVRELGGTMQLRGLQPPVRKVLEHARVIHMFDLPGEEARGE